MLHTHTHRGQKFFSLTERIGIIYAYYGVLGKSTAWFPIINVVLPTRLQELSSADLALPFPVKDFSSL